MKIANYTETRSTSEGLNKYPLSTDTLQFIQEQISLLEALAGIGGSNYILRAPDGTAPGIAVIVNNGRHEVLEIEPRPVFSPRARYLTVITTENEVQADGDTYVRARTLRTAQFSATKGVESYEINNFANVSGGTLGSFPTNAALAAKIEKVPQTVIEYMRDVLAEKLTGKSLQGVTVAQLDGIRTSCVLSCTGSVSLFGMTDYTVIVTQQGCEMVRQELRQGQNQIYVRTFDGTVWGKWEQQTETAMHLDVKIVRGTVYLRHGVLGKDCDIVLLRKKRRSAWRATGGVNAYAKNRGMRKKRQPKTQYVHYKGIKLSKGEPGKWYVPKCTAVRLQATDGVLIGREIPTLCHTLLYQGSDGFYRLQGSRKRLVLKNQSNIKGTQHSGYVALGLQIARLNNAGGKDSGGEIVRLKFRVSNHLDPLVSGSSVYVWRRSLSLE